MQYKSYSSPFPDGNLSPNYHSVYRQSSRFCTDTWFWNGPDVTPMGSGSLKVSGEREVKVEAWEESSMHLRRL